MPYDESKLLPLLAKGDADAFTMVMYHHKNRVYKVAMMLLKDQALAEDIVQEVFLKVWMNREEVLYIRNLEAYIYRIGRNLTINQLKKIIAERVRVQKLEPKLMHVSDADHAVRTEQFEDKLNGAIDNLTPQQKLVFRMVKIEGLSYNMIAQKLNISQMTVRTHMHEAIKSVQANVPELRFTLLLFALTLEAQNPLFLG
jgi:RNA polymerase sigma-70 factor (ECF subfamily)